MKQTVPFDLDDEPPLSRSTYILLGVFLGWLGVHNFYAGHTRRALLQIGLTLAYPLGFILLQLSPRAGWQYVAFIGSIFLVSGLLLVVSIVRDIIVTRKDGKGDWMR